MKAFALRLSRQRELHVWCQVQRRTTEGPETRPPGRSPCVGMSRFAWRREKKVIHYITGDGTRLPPGSNELHIQVTTTSSHLGDERQTEPFRSDGKTPGWIHGTRIELPYIDPSLGNLQVVELGTRIELPYIDPIVWGTFKWWSLVFRFLVCWSAGDLRSRGPDRSFP